MQFLFVLMCIFPAGDWPQFRGPDSNGHSGEPSTPLEWSDTKNVAWKVSIPGLGWSSPAIAEGKVFVTTAVSGQDKDLSLRVLALDAATGATIWDQEVRSFDAAPASHAKNSQASPCMLNSVIHTGRLSWQNNGVCCREEF